MAAINNNDIYEEIYYHVTFTTFGRKKCLDGLDERKALYAYIFGICKRNNCHVYRIGGVEDHVHLAFALNPRVALTTLIDDIQGFSEKFIKKQSLFPRFVGWQSGFGVFTFGKKDKDKVIEYVKNQVEHHKAQNFTIDLEIKLLMI